MRGFLFLSARSTPQTTLEAARADAEAERAAAATELAETREQLDAARAQAAETRAALDLALVEGSEARVAAQEAAARARSLEEELVRETRRARELEAESDATIGELRAKARRRGGLPSRAPLASAVFASRAHGRRVKWRLTCPAAPPVALPRTHVPPAQLQKERKNAIELERVADEASAERRRMMVEVEDRVEAVRMAADQERAAFARERADAANTIAKLRAATQLDLMAHREESEGFCRELREAQEGRVRAPPLAPPVAAHASTSLAPGACPAPGRKRGEVCASPQRVSPQ